MSSWSSSQAGDRPLKKRDIKGTLLLLTVLLALMVTACGKYTGIAAAAAKEEPKTESGDEMKGYDFSAFENVEIAGIDLDSLTDEELSVLYVQAKYCQAMTDADIDTMRELVSEDMVFTHISGMKQTREEYFSDISNGNLRYFTIGIDDPVIKVDGDKARITYTSVLNANAYGSRGTYRMKGTHFYEKSDGVWILVNR